MFKKRQLQRHFNGTFTFRVQRWLAEENEDGGRCGRETKNYNLFKKNFNFLLSMVLPIFCRGPHYFLFLTQIPIIGIFWPFLAIFGQKCAFLVVCQDNQGSMLEIKNEILFMRTPANNGEGYRKMVINIHFEQVMIYCAPTWRPFLAKNWHLQRRTHMARTNCLRLMQSNK